MVSSQAVLQDAWRMRRGMVRHLQAHVGRELTCRAAKAAS
jgi:hypothetical protein